jgi:hypothetical protein
MAASRLNDSQKQELVIRYRQGETAQALAQAYGCSPNTVSRVLKAAVDPAEMAALKKQSRSRIEASTDDGPVDAQADDFGPPAAADQDPAPAQVDPPEELQASDDLRAADELQPQEEADAVPGVLAIDDADDFGDDGLDDGADDDVEELEPVAVLAAIDPADPQAAVSARLLARGVLPASVYLLVDKTVELEARPLREFSELGSLPEQEQERQALMLYTNPRQAKRQCGRTQRVIKVPDSDVFERTSRYLLAQGISRLVLEGGALFALPGS